MLPRYIRSIYVYETLAIKRPPQKNRSNRNEVFEKEASTTLDARKRNEVLQEYSKQCKLAEIVSDKTVKTLWTYHENTEFREPGNH